MRVSPLHGCLPDQSTLGIDLLYAFLRLLVQLFLRVLTRRGDERHFFLFNNGVLVYFVSGEIWRAGTEKGESRVKSPG